MSNVYMSSLDLTRSASFLNQLTAQESSYLLNDGDILLTLTGTVGKRDYGYSYQINGEKNLILNQRVARLVADKEKVDPQFLYYQLKHPRFLNQFFYSARGGTGNQANVSANDVLDLRIQLPSLSEQHKIAMILSTWDKAIAAEQALISALENRHRALMQRLLTGRQRLKAFEGEWKEVRLGEVFEEITETNDGDGHVAMTISASRGLVKQQDKFDRVIAGDSLSKYTLLRRGDFAYNKGNSKLYEMGCIYQLDEVDSAVVPFVYICFRPIQEISKPFWRHWFTAHGLDQQLKRIITSGARGDGLLNVNTHDFFRLIIPFPLPKEQQAIAAVLTMSESEMAIRRKRLNTLRLEKNGLMQLLLTGKKRVTI